MNNKDNPSKPENPSAFPDPLTTTYCQKGMTLRDYFAAAAMQSIYSAYYSNKETTKAFKEMAENRGHGVDDEISKAAYEAADAMLKERSGHE